MSVFEHIISLIFYYTFSISEVW